jgi:pyrimidine-nucleoside phosphorylase
MVDLIEKKRNGHTLTTDEIRFFIKAYVDGTVPDYQAAALLMAVWFRGMDKNETTDLTLAMVDSGDRIDLSAIPGTKVDKHSTGGVADTTTLVVGPLVAAAGGYVAKMSGRGLGHTGGTLDKLESIPGFSVNHSMENFVDIVRSCGVSVIGQTGTLVPADKKLYGLRDVTGTIDNVSLIAASVMSKKIAAGADKIVLDVKTGSGAFMRRIEDAENLARMMVEIGTLSGRETRALVTNMNQPLGNAVGNALEVEEAVYILRGEASGDLLDLSFDLAEAMLLLGGLYPDSSSARKALDHALSSGEALRRLACMIKHQGGEPAVVEDTSLLPHASEIIPVPAGRSGYLTAFDTTSLGICALLLGAGRSRKEDIIDPAVGFWMKKRLGDPVERGETIAEFHVNSRKNLDEALKRFQEAVEIGETAPPPQPLRFSSLP